MTHSGIRVALTLIMYDLIKTPQWRRKIYVLCLGVCTGIVATVADTQPGLGEYSYRGDLQMIGAGCSYGSAEISPSVIGGSALPLGQNLFTAISQASPFGNLQYSRGIASAPIEDFARNFNVVYQMRQQSMVNGFLTGYPPNSSIFGASPFSNYYNTLFPAMSFLGVQYY